MLFYVFIFLYYYILILDSNLKNNPKYDIFLNKDKLMEKENSNIKGNLIIKLLNYLI